MSFKRKLTPEREQELLVEYEDGWTVNELTIIYRVSERTVYRILAEKQMPRVRRKPGRPRLRARRKKPIRELKPCGTNAAYQRHRRAGQYPCTACLEAHAADVMTYKKRGK